MVKAVTKSPVKTTAASLKSTDVKFGDSFLSDPSKALKAKGLVISDAEATRHAFIVQSPPRHASDATRREFPRQKTEVHHVRRRLQNSRHPCGRTAFREPGSTGSRSARDCRARSAGRLRSQSDLRQPLFRQQDRRSPLPEALWNTDPESSSAFSTLSDFVSVSMRVSLIFPVRVK